MSAGSEGSGGQLARTSSHYMGPVGSEALTQHWVQHGWGDAGHVMNRQDSAGISIAPAPCILAQMTCHTLLRFAHMQPHDPLQKGWHASLQDAF